MISPARLQDYMRTVARRSYETVPLPPFTGFFHPRDDLPFFNYAIPDRPAAGEGELFLAALRAAFEARDRLPRFEFIEEYAPALPAALRRAGFEQEARLPLMLCTPESFRPPPGMEGLTVTRVTGESGRDVARAFLSTQRQGFGSRKDGEVAEEEVTDFLGGMGNRGRFLARLDGAPVSVASFTEPIGGLTELAGIATLEGMRRRGLASAVTAAAVAVAFGEGVEVAFLTAADERAGRLYERVGFRPCATALAYRLT